MENFHDGQYTQEAIDALPMNQNLKCSGERKGTISKSMMHVL